MTREQIRDVRRLRDFGIDTETATNMIEYFTRSRIRIGELSQDLVGVKWAELWEVSSRDPIDYRLN